MALTDNLDRILDPKLREIYRGVAQTAAVRRDKAEAKAQEKPYRQHLHQSYSTPATPDTVALTNRITGDRDVAYTFPTDEELAKELGARLKKTRPAEKDPPALFGEAVK